MQASTLSENKPLLSRLMFTIMVLYATLPHIATDIYVPSLPHITTALLSTPATIQLSVAAFMFGFSLSHLIYGPLSDCFGRRPPMLIGMGMSVLGTLFCLFTTSDTILIIGRLIQGIGVAACNSVGRSISRDLLDGSQLACIGSTFGMMMVFVTAMAPTLGGFIQDNLGWRAVFAFLFFYTTFVLIFTWRHLPETNHTLNKTAIHLQPLIQNYRSLLCNRSFIGYTLCVSAAYGAVLAYVTSAPFLIQKVLGFTAAQFGLLSFVIGGSLFVSFFINSRLVQKLGVAKMTGLGSSMIFTGGLIMLLLAWFMPIQLITIIGPISLVCFGAGLTFPNAFAGALHPFPHMAGSASALFGCLQIMGGTLASSMMAKFHSLSQIPLAIFIVSIGGCSLLAWKYLAAHEQTH